LFCTKDPLSFLLDVMSLRSTLFTWKWHLKPWPRRHVVPVWPHRASTCRRLSSELDPPQPVAEPLLHQGGEVAGGAWQRLLLEDRPVLGGQADRAGLQETKAPGSPLLQDPPRTPLLQVWVLTASSLSIIRVLKHRYCICFASLELQIILETFFKSIFF